ncbi:sigma-70 family RNA polymerase sigma factor [Bacillus toyonensis]|uniref:sigma-70 family RNA polymerase sigma factor n=1 Tax=Bacillus toyonensis TaxID=155322 RepID=UPI002ACB14FC|nr:sigma-70 family RNA polymerase sigma factor [Bacillus toyonensis]UKS61302.1 sigma-70 family RNA polymerase sigma factor [Bacillus toyonensis]
MDELTVEMFEIEDKEDLIDEIMNKYGQEALQLVYSYVNNKEVVEDLTQDIFVKCYKSLHTYKGNSNLKTWLWRIAINHCKDYLKSWYNKKVIVTEDDFTYMKSQKESVEQTVIQNAEDSRLASAVMNLPIKYREVIYLFYYEELAIKEIATISLPFISYGLTPTVFHALLMGIVLSVYRRKDMSFRMKRTP